MDWNVLCKSETVTPLAKICLIISRWSAVLFGCRWQVASKQRQSATHPGCSSRVWDTMTGTSHMSSYKLSSAILDFKLAAKIAWAASWLRSKSVSGNQWKVLLKVDNKNIEQVLPGKIIMVLASTPHQPLKIVYLDFCACCYRDAMVRGEKTWENTEQLVSLWTFHHNFS